jgi:predicted dehydrogenase
MAEHAAERGAHVLCEKPLGRDGAEGRAMLEAVERAGVKHAYGTTSHYAPGLAEARALLVGGGIGEVLGLEVVDHLGMSPLLPYCWVHSLQLGGGLLFNGYPHFLAQAQRVTGGVARWATGRTDLGVARVPVGPPLHDFRDWAPLTPAEAAQADWRENDADLSATVTTGIELPDGRVVPTLFHISALTTALAPGHLAVHGTEGTLHLEGQPWYHRLQHLTTASGACTEVPLRAADDPVQAGWDQLVAAFVADIEGRGTTDYPTFRDGCAANLLIDQVRGAGAGPADHGARTGAPAPRRS